MKNNKEKVFLEKSLNVLFLSAVILMFIGFIICIWIGGDGIKITLTAAAVASGILTCYWLIKPNEDNKGE